MQDYNPLFENSCIEAHGVFEAITGDKIKFFGDWKPGARIFGITEIDDVQELQQIYDLAVGQPGANDEKPLIIGRLTISKNGHTCTVHVKDIVFRG